MNELVFDVHNTEIERIKPMIKHEMETRSSLPYHLRLIWGTGNNWLEAH